MRAAVRNSMLPLAARFTPRRRVLDTRRVLILQPDHLGDIILSEPAVRLLRERLPEHELLAVVGPWSEEIARLAWPVDAVLPLDFPGFARGHRSASKPHSPYMRLRAEASRLRTLRASAAVVLREDAWWAAWLARLATFGPVVTGHHPQSAAFSTVAIDTGDVSHRTAKALTIASCLIEDLALSAARPVASSVWDMSPSIAVPDGAFEASRRLLDSLDIARPFVVIHPGTGAPVKNWPLRHWRALSDALAPMPVVVTGSGSERSDCELLADGQEHAHVLAGQTSLETLCGLLAHAVLAVGTDNGPMHLAGAVGTPTIRLFGPSLQALYGPPPGSCSQIVIEAGWSCSRCGDLSLARQSGCGCMAAISPEQVRREIDKLLAHAA